MSSNDSDQSPLLASNSCVKDDKSDLCTNDNNVIDNDHDNNNEEAPVTASEDGDGSSWGWVVVAASFYCVGVVGGVCNMTGVLLDSLQRDLSGDVAAISLTGMHCTGLDVSFFCTLTTQAACWWRSGRYSVSPSPASSSPSTAAAGSAWRGRRWRHSASWRPVSSPAFRSSSSATPWSPASASA